MKPRELYGQHAAASPLDGRSAVPAARDVQVAEWLRKVLDGRGRRSPELVELATGDGALSIELAKRLPDARILGVDIVPAHTERASMAAACAGLSSRVSFRALDLEEGLAELPSELADAVLAMDVLEHLFDVFGFVEHLRRILRPQGILVLRVPNVAYIRHRITLARGRLPVTASWFGPSGDMRAWRSVWGWDGGHLHYFTHASLVQLLAESGFRILECRDPGVRFEGIRRALPGLLIGNLCVMAERSR